MPPSSSKRDCDALDDDDCAPSSGVKVNILLVGVQRLGHLRLRLTERVWEGNTSNRVKGRSSLLKKGISALSWRLPGVTSCFLVNTEDQRRPVEIGRNQLSRSLSLTVMFAWFVH